MKKTVMTVLTSVVLAGATIGAAAAAERHHVRPYHRSAPVLSERYNAPGFRNSYGWSSPYYGSSSPYEDNAYWASRLEGGVISAPAGH